MSTGIYLKDVEKLQASTDKIIKVLNSERTALLLAQARLVRDRIVEKAPRGPTGNLKRAGYAVALPETTTTMAVAFAGVRPRRAPHAHLVEFGHGGPHPAPPHPFVRPAWDEMKGTVRRNIADALGKNIEGAVS